MRAKMRPELCPARTVSAPVGGAPFEYRPWVEVALQVRARVPAWGLEEDGWVHWAVPVRAGRPDLNAATPFDPGRRAAVVGEPPEGVRQGETRLDESEAARICEALLARWRPQIHFHSVLRIPSRLEEPLEDFRRHCLRLLPPPLRGGGPQGSKEAEAAPLAASIESRALTDDELLVLTLRVGLGWYPAGVEPVAAPTDPLMRGPAWRGP
jgi:hypothetical protein